MDLGSIHACVGACGARNGERGSQLGAARGPDLHLTSIHVHAFKAVHKAHGDSITRSACARFVKCNFGGSGACAKFL